MAHPCPAGCVSEDSILGTKLIVNSLWKLVFLPPFSYKHQSVGKFGQEPLPKAPERGCGQGATSCSM